MSEEITINDLIREWFDIINGTVFDNLEWRVDIINGIPEISSLKREDDSDWWNGLYCCEHNAWNGVENLVKDVGNNWRNYDIIPVDEGGILRLDFKEIPVVRRCAAKTVDGRRCKNRTSISDMCYVHYL
jgi:hypothetical protein